MVYLCFYYLFLNAGKQFAACLPPSLGFFIICKNSIFLKFQLIFWPENFDLFRIFLDELLQIEVFPDN